MKKIFVTLLAVLFILLLLPLCIIFLMGHAPRKPEAGEVSLYLSKEQRVAVMSEEKYLEGALLSFMPSDYDDEALKAGAVLLRSLMETKKNTADKSHQGAALCDDFTHCLAFSERDVPERVQAAVNATEGEILKSGGDAVSDLLPFKIYDADALAKSGMTYESILKNYYPGAELDAQ